MTKSSSDHSSRPSDAEAKPALPPLPSVLRKELRSDLDQVDRRLIALVRERSELEARLLGTRARDEGAAAAELFKLLARRRAWAVDEGVDPLLAERVFTLLIGAAVAAEVDRRGYYNTTAYTGGAAPSDERPTSSRSGR
jgi:chorismate mutase